MTRAVVFLTTTLLLASLGAVAQNNSSPSGGQSASAQATPPAQNAPPVAPSNDAAGQSAATDTQRNGIENSVQNGSQQDKSMAELPQTSTILPLLGLLGLGSLVAGLFARR
jgi:hypothetical protein